MCVVVLGMGIGWLLLAEVDYGCCGVVMECGYDGSSKCIRILILQ